MKSKSFVLNEKRKERDKSNKTFFLISLHFIHPSIISVKVDVFYIIIIIIVNLSVI